MKKYKLKKWVKNTLIIIAITVSLLLLRNMQKSFIETCVNQGYSLNYCVKHS